MQITESQIEQNFIELLKKQDYKYFKGSELNQDGSNPQRENLSSIVLENQLKSSLRKINPELPESARVEAFRKIINLGSDDLMNNNEKFHQMLTDGITIEYFKDGNSYGLRVELIDFENIEKNEFWVVNQFVVKNENQIKRLDVVLFANGLPLVVIELKNALGQNSSLQKAYNQIQNYKKSIPSLFHYNSLCIISDGIDAKVSSVSAPFSRFAPWKSPRKEENGKLPELQLLCENLLEKENLLKLIRYCTVFETEEVRNPQTGVFSLRKIKKVAAYHQYYVVEKAVQSTLKALNKNLTNHKDGSKKAGVVWHTQGSGKSLSMVFYTGRLVVEPEMKNPTIVILTDRNDLDDQLFGTFSNCKNLLRQTPVQAKSRNHLKELLNVVGGGIIFTTIQKFYPEVGFIFDEISNRNNIVVLADEAHRSQYGFKGKVNEQGYLKYGNAKYLRDAIPNATYIGFTGTPIEKEDRDTQKVFGNYIDIYDIAQAVEDGATVPISYESRLVKIKFNNNNIDEIDNCVREIESSYEGDLEKAKKKNAQINKIVGHPERLKDIAQDIVFHFEQRQQVFEGKGMIVCMTRQIAVDLFEQIIKLRLEWYNDNLLNGKIKIVMTHNPDDPHSFQKHKTTKSDRKNLATRFKDSNDELTLVIVQSMWLTGFDAPPLHTMYLDKKMQGAALMQAIARVNRVYKDKPGGLIVDYIGIGQDLRSAMSVYTESGGEGESVVDAREILNAMLSKFEVVSQMFYGFDYESYFTAEINEKLQILLNAQNFILSDEDLKERFKTELSSLSKLYAMSVPSKEADSIKEHIAFFQAIKSRLKKLSSSAKNVDYQTNTAVKQIVDEALQSDGIINVFEAAGLKTPSVSILSDEFLLEVKNMKHKNLAFELLKKILNDEVKVRKTKNIAQFKKFSEMLSEVITRYNNNQIDTAQVITELSEIAKEMNIEDHKADELGLSPEEYAFYTVLSQNSSTNYLEDHKMKELIHLIVDIIRKNTTVDWHKRDDVRAKLRLLVKKVLIKYGYPPDVARMEADNVLKQSELLASEFSG